MRLPRRWSPTKNSPRPLINMKTIIQTLTAVLLSCGLHLSAEQIAKAPVITEEQAIEHLTKTSSFGFGSGKGAVEGTSDTAFKVIASSPNAKEKFTSLFEKGGTASKLYALCALRSIDPPAFEKLSKSMKPDEVILTHFGCVVDEIKISKIIENISKGDYDFYLKANKQ